MIDRRIEDRLRLLGLNGCYQGYECLIHAMHIMERDPAAAELVTKCIYPEVARRSNLSIASVDSAIRTAIRVCRRRNPSELARICGTQREPTVAQFLTGLFSFLDEPLDQGGRQR